MVTVHPHGTVGWGSSQHAPESPNVRWVNAEGRRDPWSRGSTGCQAGLRSRFGSSLDKVRNISRWGEHALARYALLLRGVNVGTRNSLPMVELRAMLEAAGCTCVRTLLQSGNAVFETRLAPAALARAIEEPLERRMGRPIATTLRTLAELRRILEGNPFVREADDPARLCVTFLSATPTAVEVAPIAGRRWGPELVKVAGREIYSWHPDGQGKSALAEAIQRLPLRGTATTRNWNTVRKLAALLEEG